MTLILIIALALMTLLCGWNYIAKRFWRYGYREKSKALMEANELVRKQNAELMKLVCNEPKEEWPSEIG